MLISYYPFGMPMPSRQRVGGELYRYAYQGQEKDTETDKEAFQLRLWDGRIGRWLTTDPYGQFSSPYMGMGNNPISLVDPDGGCVGPDCIEGSAGTIGTDQNGLGWTWDGEAWNTNFSIGLNEVNISAQGEGGNGIDADDIWVGATGTYLSTVGNVGQNAWWWKDAKEVYRSTKLLQVGSNGKYVQGVQGLRNSYTIAGKAASLTKIAGNTLGAIGVGINIYDMTQNGINVSNSIDTIMGATTFVPVVGWVISGTYFTASFVTELSTGKSISQHAQGLVKKW